MEYLIATESSNFLTTRQVYSSSCKARALELNEMTKMFSSHRFATHSTQQ